MERNFSLKDNITLKKEVLNYLEELDQFNISFESLCNSVPRIKHIKDELFNIAQNSVNDKELMKIIMVKKSIPLKYLSHKKKHRKRFIKQWRIYILALILIFRGSEYSFLKSYVSMPSNCEGLNSEGIVLDIKKDKAGLITPQGSFIYVSPSFHSPVLGSYYIGKELHIKVPLNSFRIFFTAVKLLFLIFIFLYIVKFNN
ncbi:hypothetical protein [Clostridium polynesiense]|uniref:hypothetical protein n=1 Tax=Clostridium polynesiense TaxID=1325933 RepID=UPI00058F66DF|nr:hypothetical protein [Clostridium polynesiense]